MHMTELVCRLALRAVVDMSRIVRVFVSHFIPPCRLVEVDTCMHDRTRNGQAKYVHLLSTIISNTFVSADRSMYNTSTSL